jgi:ribosomal protein S18 acetylase RimI-like enzyme
MPDDPSKLITEQLTSLSDNMPMLTILLREMTEQTPEEQVVKNLQRIITDPRVALIVVREEGEIQGCIIVNLILKAARIEARIDEVVVSPAMRGKGCGKILCKAGIEWARQHGASVVELTSRPSREIANHMYQSLGFQHRETNVYSMHLES